MQSIYIRKMVDPRRAIGALTDKAIKNAICCYRDESCESNIATTLRLPANVSAFYRELAKQMGGISLQAAITLSLTGMVEAMENELERSTTES